MTIESTPAERPIPFENLLVPVDFSTSSQEAFRRALAWMRPADGGLIILLHVLDTALVDFAEQHGFESRENILLRMRQQAQLRLERLRADASGISIDVIISEGSPFLEILKKADDFAVDLILMGKVGYRGTVEHLLFGSTAEKVLRGSRRPVLVLPPEETAE